MATNKFILPIAAITAVVIVLVTSGLFVANSERLTGLPLLQPTADDAVIVAKRTLLETKTGEIVMVGDSSTFHGLIPSVITDASGLSAINLGTLSSMTTVGFSELAYSAVERGGIKAIIYAILPQSLEVSRDAAVEMRQLGRYLAAYGEHFNLYGAGIADYLDWYIRKPRINRFPTEFEGSYAAFLQAIYRQSGFYPEKNIDLQIQDVKDEFEPAPFSVNALMATQKMAEATGIPVYFLINPKPVSAVTDQYVKGVNHFFAQLRRDYPKLQFLKPLFTPHDDLEFGTETHLLPDFALKYSREIGAILTRKLTEYR